ncbi:MAG: UvrD-helicase domain-containing protein [Clostridia bacterium]|nr:UvrD-helicase domain-containing protein [Clostridia bacterium]
MTTHFDALNSKQQEAVKLIQGPVMVFAGAGSGKTRVLTNRIAEMITECGVDPYNILAITFTNKATREMQERLARMTDRISGMWISTFHSMCARILRYEVDATGYNRGFSIYSDTETQRVIKKIVKELHLDDEDKDNGYAAHISKAKNLAMSPQRYCDEFEPADNFDGSLLRVMERYNSALKQDNAMDFDDLLYNTFLLFSENAEVLERYRDRFTYISVDEFQDTNKVQYCLLKLLAQKKRNIFVVGDDDQSIYGWRGADVENINSFIKDFPEARVVKLEQNYRSTKKILGVANAIIEKNFDRQSKRLWTENSDGAAVELRACGSESDEGMYVASQIKSLIRYNGYKYKDFAVLMRLNALTRSFEHAMNDLGIPYKVYGGFKFYDRKEVKDITAYLRLINNPSDTEAFYRIINYPKRGIGEATLRKLDSLSVKYCTSPFLAIENVVETDLSNGVKVKLVDFYKLIAELSLMSDELSPNRLIEDLVEKVKLRELSADDADRVAVIDEYVEAANEYVKNNPDCDLTDFLQSVSLVSDLDNQNEGDCVTIATVHSAKGLEFPVVFVAGVEQGIFPVARAYFDSGQLAEERRLMYVACTRAMQRLYVTRASSRFIYGQRKEEAPSMFYKEVETAVKPTVADKVSPTEGSYGAWSTKPQRTPIEPTAANTPGSFPVGTKVEHKMFGKGVIVSLNGNNITVAFEGYGIKILSLEYAPIKKIQ